MKTYYAFFCTTHQQLDWNQNECWAADMGPVLCRMVDAVLVTAQGEENNGRG